MSEMGLGCVKTPVVAESVETFGSNCTPESQITLRTPAFDTRWRIVFSTFRRCMSFYTARVNRFTWTSPRASAHVRFTPLAAKHSRRSETSLRADFVAKVIDDVRAE
jgi:hypothetical protein